VIEAFSDRHGGPNLQERAAQTPNTFCNRGRHGSNAKPAQRPLPGERPAPHPDCDAGPQVTMKCPRAITTARAWMLPRQLPMVKQKQAPYREGRLSEFSRTRGRHCSRLRDAVVVAPGGYRV
jgi:hypothetical protein